MNTIDYSQISPVASWDAEADVRQAAYFNWLNAGCPEGRDEEFWLEAERQTFGYTSDEFYERMEDDYWDDGGNSMVFRDGNLGGFDMSEIQVQKR